MKKIASILILSICVVSCNLDQVSKRISTNDFSKTIYDTLVPIPEGSYAVGVLRIKAKANDTIKIGFIDEFKFEGNIDTIIKVDYYGGIKLPISFDPYKATKGDINIELIIL